MSGESKTWVKFRHKFSYGVRDWEYREILSDTQSVLEDSIAEITEDYDYSDKYRGIDYEIIDKPPTEILLKNISNAKRKIKTLQENINRWKKLIT